MAKNTLVKIYVQSILAFLLGSQLVHYYLKPMEGYQDLVEEKKSKLWQNYLSERTKNLSKDITSN